MNENGASNCFISPETHSTPEDEEDEKFDAKRVKEDLLALGIDVDHHVIGRMQKLGLSNTWMTTSKAANGLRKRNPYGVPSHVSYQKLDTRHEMKDMDCREHEKEWSGVDMQSIRLALKELENRDSALPSSSRVNALKLIQILKIQYSRSADKFVSMMLAHKNKKGLIRAGQLMKTRFVLHNTFSEMILRLHKLAAPDVIAVLFTLLAEETEINGLMTKVIDIKAFLMMLKIANDDTRRSFDDKTSKVANEVEFWNSSRRETPNGHTNAPNPQGKHSARGRVHSSKGKLHEEYSRSILGHPPQFDSPRKSKSGLYLRPRPTGKPLDDLSNPRKIRHSVAELMGCDNREMDRSGKGVKGAFMNDVMRENKSVASVMNAKEYKPIKTDPRRTLSADHIPRARYASIQDMKRDMEAGVGVPQALGKYLRQKNQYQKLTSDSRATSVNKYFLEGVNETFVRDALKNSC